MSQEVLLSIKFDVNHVDCISMSLVDSKKWEEIKQFLGKDAYKLFVLQPYVSDPPVHVYGDVFTAEKILTSIREIADPIKVNAFKQLHGTKFYTGFNFITDLFYNYEEEKISF